MTKQARAAAPAKLSNNVTGNIGLYYCCYKLSMLGWNVMPTSRNARGIDIIAYSGDASRFLGIQVKALSRRDPVPVGATLDKCMGDFWVIVNKVASGTPSAFVLTPEEVKERAVSTKTGTVQYFLQPPSYDHPDFKEKWDRIGHGGLPHA